MRGYNKNYLSELINTLRRREKSMEKIRQIILSVVLIGACSGMAFADGTAFTPLNFSDSSYTVSESAAGAPAEKLASTSTGTTTTVNLTGNKKMQSAISELDNAQVEVRNELLNYKTKYSEADAKYNEIKNERAALKKQVKATEKRIKQLDKAKDKIRKNMM